MFDWTDDIERVQYQAALTVNGSTWKGTSANKIYERETRTGKFFW